MKSAVLLYSIALGILLLGSSSLLLLCHAADWQLLLNQMTALHAANSGTLYASTVSTMSTSGIDNTATGAVGTKYPNDQVPPIPLFPSTGMRGSTTSELLLAVVVQQLVNLNPILPQMNGSIPTNLLPGGLEFKHKDFPSSSLTIHQLLTHTSGITDIARFSATPHQVAAGGSNVVSDLLTFGADFFLTTGTDGTQAVNTDFWDDQREPGQSGSFLYARTNIALLSFMVQQAIALRPTLFTGPQTVGGYIQHLLLEPFGMTNSYFLLPDGSTPQISTGLTQLSGGRVTDINAAGGVTTTIPIHAAYPADHMFITSATDMNKLLRALFIDTSSTIYSIGTQLLASMVVVSDSIRPNVIQQGFGIVMFDQNALCTSWLARSGTTECPLSANRRVWGYTQASTTTTWASMCTTSPEITTTNAAGVATTTTTTSCTTAAQASRESSFLSPVDAQYIATGAFDQLYVDRSLNQEGSIITSESQDRDASFGLGVLAGLLSAIFAVIMMSYFVEYMVQPAPVAGVVTADAYRKPPPPPGY